MVDGHPGAGRIEHQAGHAPPEVRAGDHRPGLLVGQGLGGSPVLAAADGEDGPLGQGDAGGDRCPGVLGHLNRLGQDAISHAVVAGQQVGDPQ